MKTTLCLVALTLTIGLRAQEATPMTSAGIITNLAAEYRDGQVFLTWSEAPTPEGCTLNAYVGRAPITTDSLGQATLAAHHVERHSARDWWQDPMSFISPKAANLEAFLAPYGGKLPEPVGFVIKTGGEPLDPSGGLFVHTVTEATAGPLYFAVTVTGPDGPECRDCVPGANSLADPVEALLAPPQAIYTGAGAAPARGSGAGKPLIFRLHGRGGGATAGAGAMQTNYVMFGDPRQGWREGLSHRFALTVAGDAVYVSLSNRQWAGRPVLESKDGRDHCPAINTWYYGYNSRIYETTRTENTVVPNYTEEQILSIVRWAEGTLGADPNRTYLTGGSMGGSGAVSLGMHHPDVFEYVDADVPAVAYRRGANLERLECMAGPLDEPALTDEGLDFVEHMNAIVQCARPNVDLPPIWMRSGRTDQSIAWVNNPPFYRAMNEARQSLCAYWSGGAHADASKNMPREHFNPPGSRFRRDLSYIVFTNCSDNRNPGNGDPKDGDTEGWINRGLDWEGIVDTADEYAVTVLAYYDGLQYPVTVDVTPRRLQQFRVRPGDALLVSAGGTADREVTVDEHGLITVTGVTITDRAGTRVTLRRK